MHIKKQNTQLRQLEAAAKNAEQSAESAQQQYKEHLQQLQSQLKQSQATAADTHPPPGTAEAENALHADLQSLRRQLAEAQQEVTSLQQHQAKGGSKVSAASPAQDSAAQDSVAQDASTASAEKESGKDKDTQLQVDLRL